MEEDIFSKKYNSRGAINKEETFDERNRTIPRTKEKYFWEM
jgi:hypothetical protein